MLLFNSKNLALLSGAFCLAFVWKTSSGNTLLVEGTISSVIQQKSVSSEILNESWVKLNSDVIVDVKNGRSEVEFPLFDLGEKTVSFSRWDYMADEVTIVYGKLEGKGETSAVFSIVDSNDGTNVVLSGLISLGNGRTFRIDHKHGATYKVYEESQSPPGFCSGEVSEHLVVTKSGVRNVPVKIAYQNFNETGGHMAAFNRAAKRTAIGQSPMKNNRIYSRLPKRVVEAKSGESKSVKPSKGSAQNDAKPAIMVLIMYTDDAAIEQGGVTRIRAEAGRAIGRTNIAFQRSGIKANLRIAGVRRWEYRTSGNLADDLHLLRKDGLVKRYRNQVKADLVTGIVGFSKARAAGIAYLLDQNMKDAGVADQFGFNIVMARYLGGRVLAHETGHNLGCIHATDQSGSGVFSYSYGWRFTDAKGRRFHTIMAYRKHSRERGLLLFSNPSKRYKGVPTGADIADNVRTINETANWVSKYR